MKRINLTAADRRAISNFKAITSKEKYTRDEVITWFRSVKNTAIADGENIHFRQKDRDMLDARYLTSILAPVYQEARTIALSTKPLTRRGRKAKEVTDEVNPELIKELAKVLHKFINTKSK